MKKILSLTLFTLAGIGMLSAQTDNLPGYDGRFRDGFLLTPQELVDADAESLALMRNEIVAKYGRAFQTKKYRDYFRSKTWYQVNPRYVETMLDETDNANIALILSFERPVLDEKKTRKAILDNIEYSGDGFTVTFPSAYEMLLFNENEGYYSSETSVFYAWSVKGDWILCRRDPNAADVPDYSVSYAGVLLLKLDHKERVISLMVPLDSQ